MAVSMFSPPRVDRSADAWETRSLRSLLTPRSERDRPDLPLLTVARERGVFVRSDEDANHNAIPDDLGNYKVARSGDLVINKMKAWQGSLGLAPVDGIVSPAYFVFEADFEVPRFGEYLLRSKPYVAKFGAASDGVRIGQWDLDISRMRNIEVSLPRADEQAAIAKYLAHANARIDKAIAAKTRLIALLEEQGAAQARELFSADNHGDAPFVPLKRLVATRGGMTPSKDNHAYWGGEVPWVSPKDVKSRVLQDSIDHITQTALEQTSISLVPKGAVVIVVRGMILARTVPVATLGVDSTLNQDMKALVPREGKLKSEYLRDWLRVHEAEVLELVETAGHGTKKLDTDALMNVRVPVPSLAIQESLSARIASAGAATRVAATRARSEITLLQEFRTRLIADVVTGQVDVRAIAASLPDNLEQDTQLDALLDDDLEDELGENEE